MPLKTRKITRNSAEQEGRILLAISALKKNEISTVTRAAQIFNVPRSTLRDRLKGSKYRNEARANGHKMTQNEEESLIRWILSMDQRGAAPRPSHVREMANILLAQRGSTPTQTVGEKWVFNFINRHDEITTRFSRRYNHQRAKCEDPKIILEWFNRVQITIMQHGIALEDIYNFDETGFTMGLVATAKVVTRAEMLSQPFLIQPGNREWVTSIECINSTGWVLPPCIIFKGKVHIEGWYQDMALPADWRIEVSKNGWTTDQIGLRWLQKVFIPATTSRTTGRY
jgi:predicted HTH domain antitoxin